MKNLLRQYIIPRLFIDILFFYGLLMLIGVTAARIPVDGNFLLGAIANYLMLVFAFVINDIEDKEEDVKTEYIPQSIADNIRLVLGVPTKEDYGKNAKRFKNPFAFDMLSIKTGWVILVILAFFALIFSFYAGSRGTTLIAISNIVVGILYSHKKVRLKSIPFLDFLSHSYLLAGAQVLYFTSFPNAKFDILTAAILTFTIIHSISGDLYNEVRDFEVDQQEGIINTATLLGPKATMLIGRALYAISTIALVLLISFILLSDYGLNLI